MIGPILRLIRPGDWLKNIFVLPAPIFALPTLLAADTQTLEAAGLGPASEMGMPALILRAVAALIAFSALCSGFYCINDAMDVEEDRAHPVKRSRPVAAGEISTGHALILGLCLMAAGLIIGFAVNRSLGGILATYATLQGLYNLRLKRVMFVDVVTIAIGFGLRAAAGAAAIEIRISIWLLLCVFFLCLYLGFVKRLCDLSSAEAADGSEWTPPAGYDDRVELTWLLGISAALAVVTYLMYTLSTHAHGIFGQKALGLALMIPLVLIAIHRFYRRAQTGDSDSPLAALRHDRAVLASIVLFAAGTLVTLYVPAVEHILDDLFLAVDTEPSAGGPQAPRPRAGP